MLVEAPTRLLDCASEARLGRPLWVQNLRSGRRIEAIAVGDHVVTVAAPGAAMIGRLP